MPQPTRTVFRAAWPIINEQRTPAELIDEAAALLPDLAAEAGAILCGPAEFDTTQTAAEAGIPDLEHFDGYVLVATAPATAAPAPPVTALRQPAPDRLRADAVEAALRGDDVVLSDAERRGAAIIALQDGMTIDRVAQRLRTDVDDLLQLLGGNARELIA